MDRWYAFHMIPLPPLPSVPAGVEPLDPVQDQLVQASPRPPFGPHTQEPHHANGPLVVLSPPVFGIRHSLTERFNFFAEVCDLHDRQVTDALHGDEGAGRG